LTARHTRALRLLRLVAHLARMWLAARVVAPRLTDAQRRRLIYRCAARMLSTLQVDVRIRGELPPGSRPVLLVANHISWLDTYAVHTVNAARFVAKSEVGTWPIIGTIAANFGTVFLERGSFRAAARTVGTLAQALCDGQAVAVFPESTTSTGSGVLRFYPAMFEAAVRSGARVQPVAIRYRTAAGQPSTAAAFVGEMSVVDSLRRILREPRLVSELTFCAPIDPRGQTRKQLAAAARTAIAAALDIAGSETPDAPARHAA
jgi:1-acyl-sn-glycerol-3-phosphate acyltransferase